MGKIPGSHILPLHEVPAALALTPEAFREKYGFDRPPTDAMVTNYKTIGMIEAIARGARGQFLKC